MTCEELPDAFRPLPPVHHANGDTAEIALARADGDDNPALYFRRLAALSRRLRAIVAGDDRHFSELKLGLMRGARQAHEPRLVGETRIGGGIGSQETESSKRLI